MSLPKGPATTDYKCTACGTTWTAPNPGHCFRCDTGEHARAIDQVCSVEVLGRVYDLRRADDTTCEWILRVGDLVIMAWEVSSTAGGRAWNFNNVYLEEIALRMIGDDNPMSLPSNRGDVLVLIRPVSESMRDDHVPEMTDDH